jgi:hypothetical protein
MQAVRSSSAITWSRAIASRGAGGAYSGSAIRDHGVQAVVAALQLHQHQQARGRAAAAASARRRAAAASARRRRGEERAAVELH